MDFSSLPLFGVMKSKLNYISQRQGVLAQNVANADTPGYLARDVAEPDFKAIAQGASIYRRPNLQLSVTRPGHMAGSAAMNPAFASERRDSTYELNPNGNNVVIEEEMMKLAQNQAEYQKVLGLYKKTVDLFKTAIGRTGSGA